MLWAPSCGDVVVEGASVRSESFAGREVVLADRAADGEHWVVRARVNGDAATYAWSVRARSASTGRRWEVTIGDPWAREVARDHRAIVRASHGELRRAPFTRPKLRDLVVYELHVYNFGAADPSLPFPLRGTYAGVAARLPYLIDLGVGAIELMPVFDHSDPWQPGVRWNYITTCHPCAPHREYASNPDEARREFHELVEAAHAQGVAVIIDGPFNHVSHRFGHAKIYDPDYNHHARPDLTNNPLLGSFGGTDPNPGSMPWRDHDWGACDVDYHKPAALDLVSDVLHVWFDELGVDGIRFDHTLGYYVWKDQTVGAGAVAELCRRIGGDDCYRIAEHFSSDENERTLLVDSAFESEWAKGFFYAIEEALSGRGLGHLAWRMDPRRQGFLDAKPPVVFFESHDDERVGSHGGEPWWRVQPAVVALYTHPGVPLLYMGQEWNEDAPTRWEWGQPREVNPLDWDPGEGGAALLRLHRAMGLLRRRIPALRTPGFSLLLCDDERRVLAYGRGEGDPHVIVALVFGDEDARLRIPAPGPDGTWHELLSGRELVSRGGALSEVSAAGALDQEILVPSWWAGVFCRTKAWTEEERRSLLEPPG